MKKILYIHQLFRHPGEFGGTRSYWIAQELIKQGYHVTMICQRNPLLFPGKNIPSVEFTAVDNIKVIYIRNHFSKSMGLKGKAISFFRFMFKSTWFALKEKEIDLVIATSTPLTVAFPAIIRKLIKKTPYLFEVRDLWPEGIIQMAIIKNNFLIKTLRWFEKITYRQALHVIALSPGMQKGVINHIPRSKTTMIPNMSKIDRFWPRAVDYDKISCFNLNKETFKVIYFGAMGLSNGLHYIVDAAKICMERNLQNIEFIFLGHGRVKNEIIERKMNEDLRNIILIESQPMEMTSEIVNACDVSIVTFEDIPILYTNSPNKFFDSLSAGKPIIVNSAGWTKEIVENFDCGFFVNPKDTEALFEKILFLKENPKEIKRLGSNSRKLAVERFDKSILCPKFVSVVNSLTKKSP